MLDSLDLLHYPKELSNYVIILIHQMMRGVKGGVERFNISQFGWEDSVH